MLPTRDSAARDLLPAGARLTTDEFARISAFLLDRTGIELRPGKEAMVAGRLERRLRHHGITTYAEYAQLLSSGDPEETRIAVDLLTTNETYFYRESAHFEFLADVLRDRSPQPPVRIWSAASSSGEEACTIALTLAHTLPARNWEIIGTDISSRMVETAQRGLYPIDAAQKIPLDILKRFCLRGRDEYEGYFTIESALRQRIRFLTANLLEPVGHLGAFDVVFLRNVMIYFGLDTKRAVVDRIAGTLRPGGYLIVSHSESLKELGSTLELISPSIYRKAA
ncbi:MAG: methyltransferase [Kineosporiaceae bacterium]|nr:methyltransferase [Kineosporiaceae bacterium]MBK7623370.1 methyltransferase [Kineosporiaceae bacterium]